MLHDKQISFSGDDMVVALLIEVNVTIKDARKKIESGRIDELMAELKVKLREQLITKTIRAVNKAIN